MKAFAVGVLTAYVSAHQHGRKCTIDMNRWKGEYFANYNNRKPDTVDEYCVFMQKSPTKFCSTCQKNGENCFEWKGDEKVWLSQDNFSIVLQDNGEVKWTFDKESGFSKLVDPCPKAGKCMTNHFEQLVDTEWRSWDSTDETRQTLETFKFVEEDGTFCTIGTKSKKNCYKRDGDFRLMHDKETHV